MRLEPANAVARNNLATAYAQSGRMDEAIIQFREAIKADPGNIDAHSYLGLALRTLGREREAKEEFDRAAQLQAAKGAESRAGGRP